MEKIQIRKKLDNIKVHERLVCIQYEFNFNLEMHLDDNTTKFAQYCIETVSKTLFNLSQAR